MHNPFTHLNRQPRRTGTTIDHFLLNELVSQMAFGGRRSRVYRRIVSLAGVQPGNSVLDVGCSRGTSPGSWPRPRADRSRHRGGPIGGCHRLRTAACTRGHDVHRWGRAGPAPAGLVFRRRHLHAGDPPCSRTETGGGVRRDVPGDHAWRMPAGRGLRPVTASVPAAPRRTADASRRRHGRPAGGSGCGGRSARVGSTSAELPLLHYVLAIRPERDAAP